MTNQGGKREGSGAKPKPPGKKKKTISICLSPEAVEILAGQPNKSAFVDMAVINFGRRLVG